MMRELMLENRGYKDVNPLVCGSEDCEPGHFFGPAVRSYYILHYVSAGCGVFQNERGCHTVRAGQMFVIRPGEVTVYTADEAAPWSYSWIGFECTLPLDEILGEDVASLAFCGALFESMLALPHEVGQELYICGKIYELLSLIRANQAVPHNRKAHYVRKAINYIESNCHRELEVAALAALLGLDRSYFSRIFKEQTGRTPQQFIVGYRLNRAADLMTRQSLAPGEAAAQVGYADIVNFSRMFKRKFGVSPRAFQAQNQPGRKLADAPI